MITREELFELHHETTEKCFNVLQNKNADYSEGNDPLKNFRIAELEGLKPEQGIMLRIQDKMQRIRAFISRGDLKVPGEGVYDAIEDNINYLILLKALLYEKELEGSEKNIVFRPVETIDEGIYEKEI